MNRALWLLPPAFVLLGVLAGSYSASQEVEPRVYRSAATNWGELSPANQAVVKSMMSDGKLSEWEWRGLESDRYFTGGVIYLDGKEPATALEDAKAALIARFSLETSSADPDGWYRIAGDDPKWRPVRVYVVDGKTHIQFASSDLLASPAPGQTNDKPSLFAMDGPVTIEYHTQGNEYVVDRVLSKALLTSSKDGDRQTVTIERRANDPKSGQLQ